MDNDTSSASRITTATTLGSNRTNSFPQTPHHSTKARAAAERNTSNTNAPLATADGQASIEAQIRQLERTPIKPRYDWLQRLIHVTKQLTPEERATDEARTAAVVVGQNLYEDQVIVAISAVTEALQHDYSVYDEEGLPERSLFSLMSPATLAIAKMRPIPPACAEKSLVARPRGTLMFPWIFDPRDCAARTSSNEVKKAAKKRSEHTFLVTVDSFDNRLDIPCIVIHDSAASYFLKNSEKNSEDEELWNLVQSDIKKTVSNFGIFDFSTVGEIVPPSSDGVLLRTKVAKAAQQKNGWSCGIHAILNAWAQAMFLPIYPGCLLDPRDYQMAVHIINLAIDGRASSKMIAAFLVESGFVTYKMNQRHRALRRSRINRYHQYHTGPDLDDQIYTERLAFKERVKILRARHIEESSSLLVDGAAEVTDENGKRINGATFAFLAAKPSVVTRPLIQENLHSIFETLQAEGLVVDDDEAEPTQPYKDAFIRRFLAGPFGDDKDHSNDDSELLDATVESHVYRVPEED